MFKTTTKILSNSQARELVNTHLAFFIKNQTKLAYAIHHDYQRLWLTIEKLLFAGGKRLRPYITLLTYQALTNKNPSSIIDIASAQELLHLALLIHDDIIDRDYVRYGTENVSGQYQKIYQNITNNQRQTLHYSDSVAILAGDLLISSSYQMISGSKIESSIKTSLTYTFGEAMFNVAGGELLDIESAFLPIPADSLTIAKTKTAHYSFVTPLTIGAILANADSNTTTHLKKFGYDLGMAYQLVDDLLGVFGNNLETGKSTLSDIREAKRTYLVDCFFRLANNDQKQAFNQYFGHDTLDSQDSIVIKKLLIESGAKSKTEAKIKEFKNSALKHLDQLTISDEAFKSFIRIANKATDRKS